MNLTLTERVPRLLLAAALAGFALLLAPASSWGQAMDCVACHSLHNSPGGTLNTNAEFDLICDSCHGPAGTAKFVDRHVDPDVNQASGGTGQPKWEMGCIVCHTPHQTDTVNHLFNGGAQHAHALGSDAGNMVDGVNIKLFGRDEDGTGVAKIATPLRIIGVGPSASCPNSNTDLEIATPRYDEGEGPLMSIMVGDRLIINNSNSEFDGEFRVKETDWDGFLAAPPTGWVCFDRPTSASYTPPSSDPTDGNSVFAFLRSKAWDERAKIRRANWALGEANLSLNRGYAIRVGDTIDVSGVTEVNPGTFNGLKSVTAVTNTGITAASWAAGTATVTAAEAHLIVVGDSIDVADVISAGPGSFNGSFTATVVSGSDISYALAVDPGTYTNNGSIGFPIRAEVSYAASDPGTTNVTGGQVEFVGSVKSVQSMEVVTPAGPPPFLVVAATWVDVQGGPSVVGEIELTLDRAHPFGVNDIIDVSGIDPAGYNGTFVVDSTGTTTLTYLGVDIDPGAYISGGQIPDPNAPAPALEITLTNSDSNINQFQGATTGLRDGDIIEVFDVDPAGYNGRWEVESVALPVITARCPPVFRTDVSLPACTLTGVPAYVGGGSIQSTGSLRPVVYESRGTDNSDGNFLSDYTHSFANTDEDNDGWRDGACEACHTQTANHQNDDFGNSHNNGRTCAASCHTHSTGFDKDSAFCPPGRTCPPVN